MEVTERLGELLREAGFTGRRAAELQGEAGIVPPPSALVTLGRPEDARLAVLLNLFGNDEAVSRVEIEAAVAPLTVAALVDAGFLEIDGPRIRSRFRLSEFEGVILAGDPMRESQKPEYIQALSTSSKFVAHLTVRREIGAALDLGTGSGVQALLATRHAERVVGVDINARAVALARMNQRLNRIPGDVQWAEGDWLDPVKDDRFDLVVANPPYVISPDSTFVYRDSEAGGDELSRRIVRDCAGLLNEGGFATVMFNWIHPHDDWEGPLRDWVAGLGCDALLLHCASQDPLVYAVVWNRTAAAADRETYAEAVTRWVTHYRHAGVEQIATGFVVLRRRSGEENWTQAFHADSFPNGSAGEHLERIFGAGDFSTTTSPATRFRELLSGRWRLAEGHSLDQRARYENGVYAGEAKIGHQPGLGLHANLDPRVLPVLVACDGARSLGELIRETPAPEGIEQGDFHRLCLDAVKDLIARGYLLGEALQPA